MSYDLNATKNGCIFKKQSKTIAFYRPESDWRLINGNDLGQFGEDVSLERHSPILVDTE